MPVIPVEADQPFLPHEVPDDANPELRVFPELQRAWLSGTCLLILAGSLAAWGSMELSSLFARRGLSLAWFVYPMTFAVGMLLVLELGQLIVAQYAYRLASHLGIPAEARKQLLSVFLTSIPATKGGVTSGTELAMEHAVRKAHEIAGQAEKRRGRPSTTFNVLIVASILAILTYADQIDVYYLQLGIVLSSSAFAVHEARTVIQLAESRLLSIRDVVGHALGAFYSYMLSDHIWQTPQFARNPAGRARERVLDSVIVFALITFSVTSIGCGLTLSRPVLRESDDRPTPSAWANPVHGTAVGIPLSIAVSAVLVTAGMTHSAKEQLIEIAVIADTVQAVEIHDVWQDVSDQLLNSSDGYEKESVFLGFILYPEED